MAWERSTARAGRCAASKDMGRERSTARARRWPGSGRPLEQGDVRRASTWAVSGRPLGHGDGSRAVDRSHREIFSVVWFILALLQFTNAPSGPSLQLMYMVDPLHTGNPKDTLGSQMNTLLADRTLFRHGPGLSIWVSPIVSHLYGHGNMTWVRNVTVVVVRAAPAREPHCHGQDGQRNVDDRLRCTA